MTMKKTKTKRQATIDDCAPFFVSPKAKQTADVSSPSPPAKKKKPVGTGIKREAGETIPRVVFVPQSIIPKMVEETTGAVTKREEENSELSEVLLPTHGIHPGDLVEIQHHELLDYTIFGLVDKVYTRMVKVYWLWNDANGNYEDVKVTKVSTVNVEFIKVLTKYNRPLDGKQFNWWKAEAIRKQFYFKKDVTGGHWFFQENSW